MTIELLQSNIQREKQIINELSIFSSQFEQMNGPEILEEDIRLLQNSTDSLLSQLFIVNNALPEIIENIKFYKELDSRKVTIPPEQSIAKELSKVRYNHPEDKTRKIEVGIKKQDQNKFLESVAIGKESVQKLKNKTLQVKEKDESGIISVFIRLSNKYFRELSDKLVEKQWFDSVNRDLRKITSPFLLNSYVSMILFATAISFIIGFLISVVLVAFKFYLTGVILLFICPLTVFLLFYSYPSSQRKTLEKEINQELPFVVIYMGAVATSGVEPSKIFEIIVRTKDYVYTQRELRRLLNYINFYGSDLVNALKYSSKNSPSERLAMLFNGLATTIRSGGSLTDFLEKHAETLLFDYRLEREKYTKIAETFMDIYISIVIAAPMIMMILFVLISLTGYSSMFLSPGLLTVLILFIVSGLNVGFLLFLNMKQPRF